MLYVVVVVETKAKRKNQSAVFFIACRRPTLPTRSNRVSSTLGWICIRVQGLQEHVATHHTSLRHIWFLKVDVYMYIYMYIYIWQSILLLFSTDFNHNNCEDWNVKSRRNAPDLTSIYIIATVPREEFLVCRPRQKELPPEGILNSHVDWRKGVCSWRPRTLRTQPNVLVETLSWLVSLVIKSHATRIGK